MKRYTEPSSFIARPALAFALIIGAPPFISDPKLAEDMRVKTYSGALGERSNVVQTSCLSDVAFCFYPLRVAVSLLAGSMIVFLAISEFQRYLSHTTVDHLIVDLDSPTEKLKIEFDITFDRLPCSSTCAFLRPSLLSGSIRRGHSVCKACFALSPSRNHCSVIVQCSA